MRKQIYFLTYLIYINMSIHTIGDSHCNGSWVRIPGVIRHHLGAVLCHSFGRDKLKRCDIREFSLNDGDTLQMSCS